MKFNEQHTIENHVIKFIQENLDYEYVAPAEFAKLREFENEYVVVPELIEAIFRINEGVDETLAASIVREIKKIDTNQGFLDLMRNGVNMKDPNTGKMKIYHIIDWSELERDPSTPSLSADWRIGTSLRMTGNNKFIVTNQFYFEGTSENIRPDVMIFLNGLPIVDIEAKSPTASASVTYEKAIDQIKRYERNAPRLFWPNCFGMATDGLKTVYAATYAAKQYFLEWKDTDGEIKKEMAAENLGELEISLHALLEKRRLLDIIKNFILFEKEKEQTVKKMCRYQQMRATNRICDRVAKGEVKKGLIWHTQGSGKSITMFFTAWKLRFDRELKNPKIFVLVDRIDLDDQIYSTFVNCGGENVERVTSKRDLEKKIKSAERGIFISTIQKFSELPESVKNPDENIVVLCDEAHRDNEGISAINLRYSLENAFFFGFTGTPIDKITLNTHKNFGEKGERYLDYYSIAQSIEDGATLPVTYEARLSKFFVDEEKIDEQFEMLTKELNESQKEQLNKKYGKREALVKLDKRMEAIAQDMVEHFKLYVEPSGFKAQVVCFDREAAMKYKEYFDRLIPADWSAIVYSPGDPNSESDDLKKYNTNKLQREKLIKAFKDPNNSLKFLIVCDMLLTGFDAPIEQVMYLDKPLRDHNLLQAIARTNRVASNKGCGKIIDYYGITKNLYASLNFDESIVESAMIDIDSLKKEFMVVLEEVMSMFSGVNIEDPSMPNLRKCLGIFADNEDRQQRFSEKYSRLKMLFEILSPDPFLKKYLRQFEWITSFYLAYLKEYVTEEKDINVLAQYGGKVKKLIQEKIDYEGITKTFKELTIHELATLEKMYAESDDQKAINLEKLLKREISINLDTNPIFKKFGERLVAIRNEFEKHQIDLAQRIKKYYELLGDIKKTNKEAGELGLNLKEYALYVISEEYIETGQEKILKEFIQEVRERVESILDFGWQESSKRDEFLKEIKRTLQVMALKEYKDRLKINDFPKYLNRLVDVIVKKF